MSTRRRDQKYQKDSQNIDVIVETWLKFIKFYTEFTTQISRKAFFSWHKTIKQEVILWN